MLILTRKLGESIILLTPEKVEIKIIEQRGSQIRVGVDAPRTVRILRWEIYQEIEAQNRRSASATTDALDEITKDFKTSPKNYTEHKSGGIIIRRKIKDEDDEHKN